MIWKRKKLFQNVYMIILNNFYHDYHCLEIKLRWWNRRSSQKFTEKWQNAGCMTSYDKKRDIWKKKFENVYLIVLSNFYHDQHFLKNQVKVTKLEMKSKITEKQQNDVHKWRHTSKTGHDKKKIFFQYFSDHTKQLLPW